MSQKAENEKVKEEFAELIEHIYSVADRLKIGNPDKLDLCNIAFSMRGIKGHISDMVEKLEIYNAHEDVLMKLVSTHALVSIKDLENYNKMIDLFVRWNEKKITDQEFAQKTVELLAETYNKVSHKINEVEEEIG